MDTIHIRNLVFSGVHGIAAVEEHRRQRFQVDIELKADTRSAAKSDEIEDAVDYRRVREVIREVIEGESQHLLERLADTMLRKVFEDSKVCEATVTIQKLEIWDNGIPGVTLHRKNILE